MHSRWCQPRCTVVAGQHRRYPHNGTARGGHQARRTRLLTVRRCWTAAASSAGSRQGVQLSTHVPYATRVVIQLTVWAGARGTPAHRSCPRDVVCPAFRTVHGSVGQCSATACWVAWLVHGLDAVTRHPCGVVDVRNGDVLGPTSGRCQGDVGVRVVPVFGRCWDRPGLGWSRGCRCLREARSL